MAKSRATASPEAPDPVLAGLFAYEGLSYEKGVAHLADQLAAMFAQLRANAARRAPARPAAGLGRAAQRPKPAGRK